MKDKSIERKRSARRRALAQTVGRCRLNDGELRGGLHSHRGLQSGDGTNLHKVEIAMIRILRIL